MSGTIPTVYVIFNSKHGTLKCHAGADQAAATLGNADGEIGGLTISDPLTQGEVQALRDKCEELAADVRSLSTLIHSLRTASVGVGVMKVGAWANDNRALSSLVHVLMEGGGGEWWQPSLSPFSFQSPNWQSYIEGRFGSL